MNSLPDATQTEISEERGITVEQYGNALNALGCVEKKKVSVVYKRKSCKVKIGPYSTVILKLLKSKMCVCNAYVFNIFM